MTDVAVDQSLADQARAERVEAEDRGDSEAAHAADAREASRVLVPYSESAILSAPL